MSKIYVLIDDKKRVHYTKTFYKWNAGHFKEMNEDGWGVYFAINDFEAAEEEMKEHNVKTKRNCIFLKKLKYVFADLDIAKDGDEQSIQEREDKKIKVIEALYEKCKPTKIINTANGIQPLWKIDEDNIDQETQQKYVNIINGIIEWSKTIGCAGDEVKDTTRVLRVPGFYHMKKEPYLCELVEDNDTVYTLDELKKHFYKEPKHIKLNCELGKSYALSPIDKEIERIDIKDIAIAAFASIGRICSFDKSGRIILDGRLTGGFQGKNGDKQYLASTSHETFVGNKITVVADIIGCSNKEARKWIIETFNINYKKAQVQEVVKKSIEKKPDKKPDKKILYTWGTKQLDEKITSIKSHKHIILVGETGGGKTTFAFDMAIKNAQEGVKTLFLSLEMPTEELLEVKSQDYAGITRQEDRIEKWDNQKEYKRQERKEFIKNLDKFILSGIDSELADIEAIIELIKIHKPELAIIDNFDLIGAEGTYNELERADVISKKFMNFSKEEKIPTVVLHHYKKKTDKSSRSNNDVKGSSKIVHNAHMVIKVNREKEPKNIEEQARMYVSMIKDRRFGELSVTEVYYIDGVFQDSMPFYKKYN